MRSLAGLEQGVTGFEDGHPTGHALWTLVRIGGRVDGSPQDGQRSLGHATGQADRHPALGLEARDKATTTLLCWRQCRLLPGRSDALYYGLLSKEQYVQLSDRAQSFEAVSA